VGGGVVKYEARSRFEFQEPALANRLVRGGGGKGKK